MRLRRLPESPVGVRYFAMGAVRAPAPCGDCSARVDVDLRYCVRPPFASERLSVIRGPAGRISRIRYVPPAATDRSRSWPTDRLGRARAGPSRLRRLSSFARRPSRDRHPQPLSPAGREASTKPPGGRPRRDSAPTPEKHYSGREARRSGIRCFGPENGATGSRAAQQFENACDRDCGSAIDRAILPSTSTEQHESP